MPVLAERRVAVTLYYLADEGRMRKVANALKLVRCVPGWGTLGISGWGCAARTLEPLAYTRAIFSLILLPYTRVNSPNHS